MPSTKDDIPKNIAREKTLPKHEYSPACSDSKDKRIQPGESVKKAEEIRILVKEIEILTTI